MTIRSADTRTSVSRSRTLFALCAAGPPLALVAAVGFMLVAALAGRHPLWRPEVLNIAEAAAARDVATVAALMERGEDANSRRQVRAPLLDELAPVSATPLEAGVRTGRLEVVSLLLERGAALDEATRMSLVCEARQRGYADVAEYLVRPLARVDCDSP